MANETFSLNCEKENIMKCVIRRQADTVPKPAIVTLEWNEFTCVNKRKTDFALLDQTNVA